MFYASFLNQFCIYYEKIIRVIYNYQKLLKDVKLIIFLMKQIVFRLAEIKFPRGSLKKSPPPHKKNKK